MSCGYVLNVLGYISQFLVIFMQEAVKLGTEVKIESDIINWHDFSSRSKKTCMCTLCKFAYYFPIIFLNTIMKLHSNDTVKVDVFSLNAVIYEHQYKNTCLYCHWKFRRSMKLNNFMVAHQSWNANMLHEMCHCAVL